MRFYSNNLCLGALVIALLVGTPHVSRAEAVYRWVDDRGGTHFTGRPPQDREYRAVDLQHRPASPQATPDFGTIRISIRQGGFEPVRSALPVRWSPYGVVLQRQRPGSLRREPSLPAAEKMYGALTFGPERHQYPFLLYMPQQGKPVLYFDGNRNGDLSDDGPPLRNRGTGWFSTSIILPLDEVTGQSYLGGEYSLWFFINDSHRKNNRAAFYTHTQLKGQVTVESRAYTAYITEQNVHDGDYTNDGIAIDLNADQAIDWKTEYIAAGEVLVLGGREYAVEIGW